MYDVKAISVNNEQFARDYQISNN